MNLPILMYHIIQPDPIPGCDLAVPTARFQEQASCLCRGGYQSVTVGELAEALAGQRKLPRKPVVFTFDDALESVVRQAFPILKANGFTATVFAVSECVGQHNAWDDGKGLPRLACMTSGQLKALAAAGWEIGSHGAAHANMQGLAPADLDRETTSSKTALERLTGASVTSFCYPFGAWDAAAQAAVRRAGYTAACAIAPGTASVTADRFALRRVYVKPGDSLFAFRRKISGWYLRYRAWRKR